MLFEVKISDETQRDISTLSKVAGWLGRLSWPVWRVSCLCVPLLEGQLREVLMWPLKARPHHLASGGPGIDLYGPSPVPLGVGTQSRVCLFNSGFLLLSLISDLICGQPAATGLPGWTA